MTFEGDTAGLAVAEAIQTSPAADRRVLVDDYTRHVINDTFLALSRDPTLKQEAAASWVMFDRLQTEGVSLRVTNPVSRNPLRYPLRNHKKLLVVDNAVWVGGINFSDHNFAWHDIMLRIEGKEVADWLAGEFNADWRGQPRTSARDFSDGLHLASMDGTSNHKAFQPLLRLFAQARHSIEVVSAYPTFPFVDAMAAAAQRGVPVTIYTPRPSNKPIIRDYLLGVARRSGLTIRLLAKMTHIKAALVDGEVLVLGSSNFDFVSHRANAETIATIRDPALIADFTARVLAPARVGASEVQSADYSRLRSLRARLGLKAADAALSCLRHGERIAAWS